MWVTRHEGEPGVVGELEVTGAGPAADDPALLEGDDGGRVGGVAFGESDAEMCDRVEHPDGVGVQRRAVAVPVAGQGRDTLKVERESENPRPGRTQFKISFSGSCQKRPLAGVAAALTESWSTVTDTAR